MSHVLVDGLEPIAYNHRSLASASYGSRGTLTTVTTFETDVGQAGGPTGLELVLPGSDLTDLAPDIYRQRLVIEVFPPRPSAPVRSLTTWWD